MPKTSEPGLIVHAPDVPAWKRLTVGFTNGGFPMLVYQINEQNFVQ
jgi:hypothetical protein